MRNQISPALIGQRPLELGKIKIGGKGEKKRTSGGKDMRLPTRFDHFKVTTRIRGDDENFERDEAVHEKTGDEPRELLIRLPFNTSEECFHSRMVKYEGRKRVRECDGETMVNRQTGAEGPCSRMTTGKCDCKPSGRFPVILEAADQFGRLLHLPDHVLRVDLEHPDDAGHARGTVRLAPRAASEARSLPCRGLVRRRQGLDELEGRCRTGDRVGGSASHRPGIPSCQPDRGPGGAATSRRRTRRSR